MPWVKDEDPGSDRTGLRYERDRKKETNAEYFERINAKDQARLHALRGEVRDDPTARLAARGAWLAKQAGDPGQDAGDPEDEHGSTERHDLEPAGPDGEPAAPAGEGVSGPQDGSSNDASTEAAWIGAKVVEENSEALAMLAQFETDGGPPLPAAPEPATTVEPSTSGRTRTSAGTSGRSKTRAKRAPTKTRNRGGSAR